jgi:hypothetical protein
MDDIVAVKVRDSKAVTHYIITWGRIFDPTDPIKLESLIAKYASKFGIKNLKNVSVCDSLQAASKARYFYEALLHFSQQKIPFGERSYSVWRAKMKREMQSGRLLFYCGSPNKKS